MGFFDLLSLVIENLSRRKARVGLTAVGVVIGTSSVVILVSLAIGLQRNAQSQLFGIGDLTQIQVFPGYGDPASLGIVAEPRPGEPQPGFTPITDLSLEAFAAIPGVIQVIPQDYFQGTIHMQFGRMEAYTGATGIGLEELGVIGVTAQEGELSLQKGTAVIGSLIPTYFNDPRVRPGQEAPPPPDLVGQTLRASLIKYDQEGQEIRKTVQIRVGGVLTQKLTDPDWSVYLPLEDVTSWNEWVFGRRVNRNRDGYPMVIVRVQDSRQTVEIADLINSMGYSASTGQSVVEGINSFYLVLQIIFGGVGAIALLVAAIGIANTMAMAILERTREIGLIKAIGATNRNVLTIFLGEAAGIGFLGGLGGVLVGWSAGQVINVLALVYMAQESSQQGGIATSIAVYTPTWLLGFALVFATVIGLLSGLYPALRAATLVPVVALKYE